MNELEILELLLQATKNGNVQWSKKGFDYYFVSEIETPISIQFLYPLLAEDVTSEPDIAKVTISRLTLTFFNGTEGMSLVRRILSYGLPEWNTHSSYVKVAADEATEILTKLAFKNT